MKNYSLFFLLALVVSLNTEAQVTKKLVKEIFEEVTETVASKATMKVIRNTSKLGVKEFSEQLLKKSTSKTFTKLSKQTSEVTIDLLSKNKKFIAGEFGDEVIHTSGKSVQKNMLKAFSKSSKATKKALLDIGLKPKEVSDLLERIPIKDLTRLTEQIGDLSPSAMKNVLNGLSRLKPERGIKVLDNLTDFMSHTKSMNGVSNTLKEKVCKDLVSTGPVRGKKFIDIIKVDKRLLDAYDGLGNKLGRIYRMDEDLLKAISRGDKIIPLKTIKYKFEGKASKYVKYVRREVMIGGKKFTGVFPDFSEYTRFVAKLPKHLYHQPDNIQFGYALKQLRKQYLKDPKSMIKSLKESNKKMMKQDMVIFKKNKKAILDAQEKMLNAVKMGDKSGVDKYHKQLKKLTYEMGNIQTPKGRPFKILSESEMVKRQIYDITRRPKGTRVYGFVWHHGETPGKLNLVSKNVHNTEKHTGGNAIWGDSVR